MRSFRSSRDHRPVRDASAPVSPGQIQQSGAGATLWRMQDRCGCGCDRCRRDGIVPRPHPGGAGARRRDRRRRPVSTPTPTSVTAALGCQRLDDPMALATDASLDGVVIASPDRTHADLAIAATRGRAVGAVREAARHHHRRCAGVSSTPSRRSASRRIQLGFMREYDPAHVQLMAELPDRGRIDTLRAVHRNSNARRRPLDQIVGQSMVHDIHSVRFIRATRSRRCTPSAPAPSDDSYRHVLAVCRLDVGRPRDGRVRRRRLRLRGLGRGARRRRRRAHRHADAGRAAPQAARSTPTSGPTGSPGSPRPTAPRTRHGWHRSGRRGGRPVDVGRSRRPALSSRRCSIAGDRASRSRSNRWTQPDLLTV